MIKYITAFIAIFILFSTSPALADCTNPAKAEGVIIYNSDHKVAQFCNGTDWIGMAGGTTSIMEGDTLVEGFPDAIQCTISGGFFYLYNASSNNSGAEVQYEGIHPSTAVRLYFNKSTGAYVNSDNLTGYDCINKTISQLYADGQAFNFVGAQPLTTDTLTDLSCTDGQMVLYDTGSSDWICADVSASGAADNLGNHTATQNLDLANFEITNAAGVTLDSVTGGAAPSSNYGRITGEIQAFDLATCPDGWSEYTAARGRFLRGIDPTGTNDPDGVRVAGSTQADEFKSHTHAVRTYQGSAGSGVANVGTDVGGPWDLPNSATATGGAETRPKNVAVLFCRKD